MRWILIIAGVLLAQSQAPAQCWDGRCSPAVTAPAFAPAAPVYEWRSIDAGELALWCYGRQVGNLLLTTGEYQRRLGPGQWESEASEPPIPAPADAQRRIGELAAKRKCKAKKCGCKEGKRCADGCKCGVKIIGGDSPTEKPAPATAPIGPSSSPPTLPHSEELAMPVQNYGVRMDRISDTERFSMGGQEVTGKTALDAVGAGTVPDDSAKNSLTVMGGSADQRKAILDGLALPQFSAWKESLVVQEYEADSPMLKCGFKVSAASPTIYLQAPSGKVLARVEGYDGSTTIERVRKCDPNYDPAKDPPNSKPSPAAPDSGESIGVAGLLAVLGGLLCFGIFVAAAIAAVVLVARKMVQLA